MSVTEIFWDEVFIVRNTPGGGGGDSVYESGGDARRLA